MEKKIEMLCKAGKRSEAEDVAIKYGREIADSKEMKELQKCGDMARQMMADMPQVPDNTEHENRHICDGY